MTKTCSVCNIPSEDLGAVFCWNCGMMYRRDAKVGKPAKPVEPEKRKVKVKIDLTNFFGLLFVVIAIGSIIFAWGLAAIVSDIFTPDYTEETGTFELDEFRVEWGESNMARSNHLWMQLYPERYTVDTWEEYVTAVQNEVHMMVMAHNLTENQGYGLFVTEYHNNTKDILQFSTFGFFYKENITLRYNPSPDFYKSANKGNVTFELYQYTYPNNTIFLDRVMAYIVTITSVQI